MSGDLLQLAREDAKFFVTQAGFQEEIILMTPTRDMQLSLTGFASKHWLSHDTDGLSVNAKNVHVTIDESVLVANGYQTRNSKGEISLTRHIVSFPDSTGISKDYVVREVYPNETLGLIVMILNDYKE